MEEKSKRSFTYPEMVFLLIVLLLFLAGSVWVVNRAVANSHPPGRSDGASGGARDALDKVEAMVEDATVIYASGATAVKARSIVVDRLDFLADLTEIPPQGLSGWIHGGATSGSSSRRGEASWWRSCTRGPRRSRTRSS
jgi:hypothetical protein